MPLNNTGEFLVLLLWILDFLSAESQVVNDSASLSEEEEVTRHALETPAGSPAHNEKMRIVPSDSITFYPEVKLIYRLPRSSRSPKQGNTSSPFPVKKQGEKPVGVTGFKG